MPDAIIQLENKFYISATSSYADDRIKILNQTDTFGIFDRWGDIKQLGEEVQGIYHQGTRFISDLEFKINNNRPLLLSSAIKEENELLSVDLTNPLIQFQEKENKTDVPKGVIYIGRSKFIRNGMCYESITLINYGAEKYDFNISIKFKADFKDIFEVRGIKREKRGEIFEITHTPQNEIIIKYKGLDEIIRTAIITLYEKPDDWEDQTNAIFHISLDPHQSKAIQYAVKFIVGDADDYTISPYNKAQDQLISDIGKSRTLFANVLTSNEQFTHWLNRSQMDLMSLLAQTQYGLYPYAGVPWYNTAFGRDGIITALETLWIAPDLARDTICFLAKNQALVENAYQDAEPGKILHETRGGELVECNEIPFKQYYGSIDSTPLFVVLCGAYYKRTANLKFIKEMWPHIEKALDWIDKYGDVDGDGFVEYQHKSINGLFNQGWKDSHDSISHSSGELAEPPIALCEVQGYVYDAKYKAAELADALDKKELATKLRKQAQQLKELFNQQFWDDETGWYVLALDGQKKACMVKSSNAGHVLYSGIADKEKAMRMKENLMKDDMFSGWGIRTLSVEEKRYNPMSYHNGSVWPHDVAIIASGFSKYFFQQEVIKLTGALFDASIFIELQRLPELFCGFYRRKGEGPTAYPVACSPQAWAVGAVFMLMEACLRMEINAIEKKIVFKQPVLPDFLNNIIIEDLVVGKGKASFELHKYKNDTGLIVKSKPADWEIYVIK
ncbi:amylo-alpha-1,6-glucosidase [Solitalea sp. MAHUQ-68]|uniref:Amylo-alpha-1,6-glucosidase n=1 Tax=Solitalea agri TaxID=2953739 RepID=A0A9X2FD20_9SPHI|nr:glycogen debranching N-terminal domain-containing protein [Solitalea agri]MCO4294643.1 amylo-alpha-1,6-glucosidase [Solitalea agri]